MKIKPFLKLLSLAVVTAIAFCACNNIGGIGSDSATGSDQATSNGSANAHVQQGHPN